MKTKIFLFFLFFQTFYSFAFIVNGVTYTILSSTNVEITGYDCSNSILVIPSTVSNAGITYNVVQVGNSAFANCTILETVSLPNSIIAIHDYAFAYCSQLNSIVLPNAITSLSNGLFSFCESLNAIAIPNSVTSIENYTFQGCAALTTLTLPNSVLSIGEGAFTDCTNLTTVRLPNSITSIGSYAFNYCTSLTSIYNDMPTPLSINADVFVDVNQPACSLFVTSDACTSYEAALVWQNFNIVCFVLPDCVPDSNLVLNGSFENPVVYGLWAPVYVPNWVNLNDNNLIEIQKQVTYGFPPANGNQYCELNFNYAGNVYQTTNIIPNRPIHWSFCYSRRSSDPQENILFKLSDENNQNLWQSYYSLSSTQVWNYIEGVYYPTNNQSKLKINFVSLWNTGVGNLIDNVQVTYLDCLPPEPIFPTNIVLCNSTTEQITVSQLAPEDQVVWSTGETTSTITVLNPGTYTATITRNRGGCAPPLIFVKNVEVSVSNPTTSPISFN